MTISAQDAVRSPARACERVVAQRQVRREPERRLADERAVDVAGLLPVVDLAEAGPGAAVLELDPHLDRRAVRHVHRERRAGALLGDHARRQHAPPRGARLGRQGAGGGLRGATRRRPSRRARATIVSRRHRDVVALPVPVVGGDPVGLGECEQLVAESCHGHILAHATCGTARPVTATR